MKGLNELEPTGLQLIFNLYATKLETRIITEIDKADYNVMKPLVFEYVRSELLKYAA